MWASAGTRYGQAVALRAAGTLNRPEQATRHPRRFGYQVIGRRFLPGVEHQSAGMYPNGVYSVGEWRSAFEPSRVCWRPIMAGLRNPCACFSCRSIWGRA